MGQWYWFSRWDRLTPGDPPLVFLAPCPTARLVYVGSRGVSWQEGVLHEDSFKWAEENLCPSTGYPRHVRETWYASFPRALSVLGPRNWATLKATTPRSVSRAATNHSPERPNGSRGCQSPWRSGGPLLPSAALPSSHHLLERIVG